MRGRPDIGIEALEELLSMFTMWLVGAHHLRVGAHLVECDTRGGRYGAVMRCAETTCSACRMYDHTS
jgi:hypothetical protein